MPNDVDQWGDVPLVYVADPGWIDPVYQSYFEQLSPVSEGPYSGMYIAPESWLGYYYQPGNIRSYLVTPYSEATDEDGSELSIPTPEESWDWAKSLQPFQMAGNMLGMASTPEGFMSSPHMQQAMQSIGRSNLPSSSYADKTISNAVMQNALNTAGAWGNYMNAVAPWAHGYAQYPMNVAQLISGSY